jgi:ribosome-binding protein aMBF1 (putative translation factor)
MAEFELERMERYAKNKRIRKTMAEYGINQSELSRIMHTNDTVVSMILRYELAKSEQDAIIQAIKDWKGA